MRPLLGGPISIFIPKDKIERYENINVFKY